MKNVEVLECDLKGGGVKSDVSLGIATFSSQCTVKYYDPSIDMNLETPRITLSNMIFMMLK